MSRHRSSKGPRESTRAVRALGTPSTHTPKRASLSPSPMLHHTAIFLILMLVILQTPISANPFASGEITINPDNPTGSWQSPRALYPGESVRITINVDSSGNNYELEGSPSLSTLGPGSLWSPTSNNSPSEYTYVYEAVNAGTAPTSDAIQVDATWTEQLDPPSGGGGGTPPEPDSIDGYAVGVAYTNKPVFSWNSNPKLQFADGQTIIDFSVTASANGAAIDLADYTVKGENSWTVDSNPNGNNIAGTVKSGNPSEGELKITFDGKFQDTSPDKIGFAELDLAIAKFGSGDDLKEDRQPGGGTASPPHEMDPGGLVIASFEGSESTPIRTKLTLTGSSQNPGSNGKYFLSQQSLTKAKIYDTPVDGQEITLPKEWSSSAFGNGQTLYIESEEFAATDDPEEGTLKLKYQCELNGNTESLEDEVKLNILPVEIVDINGQGDGDDVTITPWDTSADIANENIAWIDAHTSAQNASPRMPQLQLRMPNLPQTITIEAKIEVKYERGNGARHPSRTDKDDNTDTVKIPENGNFVQVNGDTWEIYSEADWQTEMTVEGFFGGDATLTYRLKSGTNEILSPKTIKFRIGGKNPDPTRCRIYIETLEDCGPTGSLWFAYAIARSESRGYNGQASRYNQFLELPTHVQDVGRPLWGDDGGTLPGGYGMYQITGNTTSSTANISRNQLWNWQENCIAGRAIIHNKKFTKDIVDGFPVGAVDWMVCQRNTNNANGVVLPTHIVSSVTFAEGTNIRMEDACAIKLYNGGSRGRPGFVDNGNVLGFILDSQGAGQYCYWKSNASAWALSRYNNPADSKIQPFNYVLRVCEEVQP